MIKMRQMLALPWVPPTFGKAPYLWAFSVLFLFFKYLAYKPAPFEVPLLILSAILFLPLYFAAFWVSTRGVVLVLLTTCLLGCLWAPYTFSAGTFFIFAGGMCSRIKPARRAYLALGGVMLLGVMASLVLGKLSLNFVLPTLGIGLPVGIAGIMDASLRSSREQLLRKQEEVEHMATIAERERISRDLHDLLGHTLSLITLKAELAGKLAARDIAACKQEIGDIERCARNALAEVRAAVTGYRLTGFQHELAAARSSLAAAGVEMTVQVAALALPAAAENVMSLALREAVTNIIRHAGATSCALSLALEERTIVFRIADNGALKDGAAALRHGNGLLGMRERVESIGGHLALHAQQGLALELRLPAGACA